MAKKKPYKPAIAALIEECERILGVQAARGGNSYPCVRRKFTFGVWPRTHECDVTVRVANLGMAVTSKSKYQVLVETHWPTGNRDPVIGHCLAQMYVEATKLAIVCHAVVEGYTYTYTEAHASWAHLENLRRDAAADASGAA
jgi:hypothetical protein